MNHSGVLGSSLGIAGATTSATQPPLTTATSHLFPHTVPSAFDAAAAHAAQVPRMSAGTSVSNLTSGGNMGAGGVEVGAEGSSARAAVPLPPSLIRDAGVHVPDMLAGLWALWADVCGGAGRAGQAAAVAHLLPRPANCEAVEGAAARARCKAAAAAEAARQAPPAAARSQKDDGRGCFDEPCWFRPGGLCNNTVVPGAAAALCWSFTGRPLVSQQWGMWEMPA